MGDTSIAWTDKVWNPVTGCTKVSQGCKNCYAERIFHRPYPGRAFTDIRCHPERLDAPLHWKKSQRIFVDSMSDLFHEDVPDEFILQVFDIMRMCANGYSSITKRAAAPHTFQILTKRAERMHDFCTRLRFAQNDGRGLYLAKELPHNGFNPMLAMSNIWIGVSVENQATANERIPLLLRTPAAMRLISAEPLLDHVDLCNLTVPRRYGTGLLDALTCDFKTHHQEVIAGPRTGTGPIDWVIVGGESGPKARPFDIDWARSTIAQCKDAGVACFVKQLGSHPVSFNTSPHDNKLYDVAIKDRAGADPDEWPADIRVRQFPDPR